MVGPHGGAWHRSGSACDGPWLHLGIALVVPWHCHDSCLHKTWQILEGVCTGGEPVENLSFRITFVGLLLRLVVGVSGSWG